MIGIVIVVILLGIWGTVYGDLFDQRESERERLQDELAREKEKNALLTAQVRR